MSCTGGCLERRPLFICAQSGYPENTCHSLQKGEAALPSENVQVRRIIDPADPAVRAFGRLQEETYPDPDLLIPPAAFARMLAAHAGDRRNFLVVAEAGAKVIGGTLFHYLPAANTGFSSYMAVSPAFRGRGVARALHEARFAALDGAAGKPVRALFIDVIAPERMSEEEREQEARVGADPIARHRAFHRLGFRKVDVAYFQPPEVPGGEPITSMDLLCCPRTPADAIPTDWPVETMLAYWSPWFGRTRAEGYAAELRRLCGGETVSLLPLHGGA